MSQTLSEWIIAGSLYRLYASGDEATQRARSFAPLTRWMSDRSNDRGARGRDLVDFLDGYLCVNTGADRALIASFVVDERRFPYDLSPPCPKPGRPRLPWSIEPPPVELPGHLTVDGVGRRIREIRVGAPAGIRPGGAQRRETRDRHGESGD